MENWKKYGFISPEKYEFPTIININLLSGACVCSCVHCPIGRVSPENRSSYFKCASMSIDVFRKVADEIAMHPDSVLRLHSVGEPLLWDKLIDAVQYAKAHSVKTWLFTSAAIENPEIYRILCKNVDIIEVSVNSINEDDYTKTKGANLFRTVKANIEHMCEMILSQGLSVRLICSRVQTNDPQKDQEFIEYWKNIPGISDAFIRSYHDYNGILSDEVKTERKKQPCLVHWGRFNIDTDGKVIVCFNELFRKNVCSDYILGSIVEDSIESIWKSEKLNTIRSFLLNHSDETIPLPCLTCTTCQKYPPHGMTSEYQIAHLNNS